MRALALLALGPLATACASTGSGPDWSVIESELARRVEVDQEARKALFSGSSIDQAKVERMAAIDLDNTLWMKGLVENHGWPTFDRVGRQGAANAWLLVQHADHDVEFQETCLGLITDAVERDQVDAKNLAYLEDRVAMHRGRPQRYGTQFVPATDDSKRFVPYALADPDRVDEYRASVGLGPLEEYTRVINQGR